MLAATSLRLVVLIQLCHRRVEARTCNICHISHLRILRLLVMHLANILQQRMSLLHSAYSLRIARRNTVHTNPVITRTHRNYGHGNLLDGGVVLYKETIYHLVQRTVTANDHYAAKTLIYGLHGKLRNVVLVLREDQLVWDIVLAQQLGNVRQILKPAAETSHGIDDYIPNIFFRGLHDTTS